MQQVFIARDEIWRFGGDGEVDVFAVLWIALKAIDFRDVIEEQTFAPDLFQKCHDALRSKVGKLFLVPRARQNIPNFRDYFRAQAERDLLFSINSNVSRTRCG